MPRKARVAPGGMVYHILNRGNYRMKIFNKSGDYRSFLKLLDEGRKRTGMRILCWCLMPNHWHLVLWPRRDGDLSRFVGWISTTHVRRWREHRKSAGEGHLYQGRFKSFLVQDDAHLLTVLRYVEQNALRAAMVERAELWPWTSAAGRSGNLDSAAPADRLAADSGPIRLPENWRTELNKRLPEKTIERLRTSIFRGRPYGEDTWVQRTAGRLGLMHTIRDPWRPVEGEAKAKKARRATGKGK